MIRRQPKRIGLKSDHVTPRRAPSTNCRRCPWEVIAKCKNTRRAGAEVRRSCRPDPTRPQSVQLPPPVSSPLIRIGKTVGERRRRAAADIPGCGGKRKMQQGYWNAVGSASGRRLTSAGLRHCYRSSDLTSMDGRDNEQTDRQTADGRRARQYSRGRY